MAQRCYLDFEEPLRSLDSEIAVLESKRSASSADGSSSSVTRSLDHQIQELKAQRDSAVTRIHASLDSWQRVQLSRHPERPHTTDYIEGLFTDFMELHGDRRFGDDPAIISGLARFQGRSIVFIGQEKGRTTKQKIKHNFGMPKPDGYRKALRMMDLAERFQFPLICLIDTPGAHPGMDAEQRGQSGAIAENLQRMAQLRIPMVSAVIGEGGSGGALALGMADRVLMCEHAIYSVISPESCAAILWKDSSKGALAAKELRIEAHNALKLGVIDGVIEEPRGGAHRDHARAIASVGACIEKALESVMKDELDHILRKRFEKFRKLGSESALS